jgi:hypothetical protein
MNMQEIRAIAREWQISPGRYRKVELVRRIQRSEGNFDCFATASQQVCDQAECLWQKDCFREAAKAAET